MDQVEKKDKQGEQTYTEDVGDGEGVGGEVVEEVGLALGHHHQGLPPLLLPHALQLVHELPGGGLGPVALPTLGQLCVGLEVLRLPTGQPLVPPQGVTSVELLSTAVTIEG